MHLDIKGLTKFFVSNSYDASASVGHAHLSLGDRTHLNNKKEGEVAGDIATLER